MASKSCTFTDSPKKDQSTFASNRNIQSSALLITLHDVDIQGWVMPVMRGIDGLLLGFVARRRFKNRWIIIPRSLCILMGLSVFPVFNYFNDTPILMPSILFALSILGIARFESRAASMRGSKLRKILGENSYGTYVWHVPVSGLYAIVIEKTLGSDPWLANNFYLNLVTVSGLLY